jgi:prokaryotic ubiquitin-like protein Pup
LAEREQIQQRVEKASEDDEVVTTATGVDTSKADNLLDEIDAVLEKNAAEFIKGFVQKGGQ